MDLTSVKKAKEGDTNEIRKHYIRKYAINV